MGFENYDFDGEPTIHVGECPACETNLECAREWAVHVEGETPSNVWIDYDVAEDELQHVPDNVVLIDDRHEFSCSHDHGDTCGAAQY